MEGSGGEFFGSGQFYRYAITCCPELKLISIDDCRQFDNRAQIKREFGDNENVRIISLKELVKIAKITAKVCWEDACGPFSKNQMREDIKNWISIMPERGTIFITRQIGRERKLGLPKGASRKDIETRIEELIEELWTELNVFADPIFDFEYKSNPTGNKPSGCRMRVTGYRITKLNEILWKESPLIKTNSKEMV
jgi:hypothetical protein